LTYTCYEGFYWIHFTVAFLGLIVTFFFSLNISLFYIDTNLYSKKPFASPASKINVYKLFVKVALIFINQVV